MPEVTTTVSVDRNADLVYELDITSDVKFAHMRTGRQKDASAAPPAICMLRLRNDAGTYSPKGAVSPLHPMDGVRVVCEGQNLFTGFIRRVFQQPDGNRQEMIVDCADWLWLLSRKDISLPVMLNVRSDILAHRAADLAEIGEHVDNPRFRTDLTGYSVLGTGTNTRVTDGDRLEGPAAMESVISAAVSGWRYAIPHDVDADFQSRKVTASAYVWTPLDADVGETINLRLMDSVGIIATTNITLARHPKRLTVSGTFNAAATDFYIDAYMLTTATFRTGAVHCVNFERAMPRDFDDGLSRFSHIAPRREKALKVIRDAAENELGGYVYVNGSGTLVFEDRHHRWREAAGVTSQGTVDEAMVDLPLEEDAEDLIGEVELHYVHWEEGDAAATVFALFPVPRLIPPNGTLTIDGDYGAIVQDFIVPAANTDYTINANPEGGGADESASATLSFEDFGGGFQAVFTSSVARAIWLTAFAVRGTPVRIASDQPQEVYTPSGAPDYASKLRFGYNLATQQPHVSAWARYLGDRYVTQRERLPVPLLNKTAALVTQMTTRVISDRVTLVNDTTDYSTKVNGAYYVDAVEHTLSDGKTKLATTWLVIPVDADYFIIGTDTIDGAAVLAP